MVKTPLTNVEGPDVPATVKLVKLAVGGVGIFKTVPTSVAAPVPVVVKVFCVLA